MAYRRLETLPLDWTLIFKKMSYKSTFNIFSAFVLLNVILMSTSCRKFIEVPAPPNSITSDQIFVDSVNATSAINGIYINMMNNGFSIGFANASTTLFSGMAADELDNPTNTANYKEFFANAITPTNAANVTFWNNIYTYLYEANACIEGAAASTTLDQSVKNRITGEAKFLRAFYHFYLMNLYGTAPLVTTPNYNITSRLPKASRAEMTAQIMTDLNDALQLLNGDRAAINKSRVNRFAVSALLARVNLYQQQWAAAEAAATTVINANYKLEPSLNNVFLTGNQEQIWQMTPVAPGLETTEGQTIIPAAPTLVPAFVVTSGLMNAYETGDQRKVNWLKSVTIGANTYTYPFKYKLVRDNNTSPREAYSVLRLAEQYLIRAEARAQQGNVTGAMADLNAIRNRAGLANTTAAGQAELLTAIQRERRVEFACEWGHRWLDLKRTQTADAVLGGKPNWKSTAVLFPIPNAQLLLNPFLTQNPGY